MNSRITKTVALAALMAGSAGVANATEGWYGRADVGYSWDGDVDSNRFTLGDVELERDWTQHLGLGYAFQNGFRLEGELGHRFNQLDGGDNAAVTNGDVHAWSAMANLFYDFNRGGSIEPYIGVGVGAARLNANAFGPPPATGVNFDGEDTGVAYQAMVGAAISVTEQLDIDVGYRYFSAADQEIEGVRPTTDYDYRHQALTVGLRYQFAAPVAPLPPPPPPVVAPPPPPPPQAVACPTGNHVVYFEWDRSNLTSEAITVIDTAVAQARRCNINGITLVGNTDTSGSPAYNQGLSERRASVVRDALVARGIAASSITSEARGETSLARQTADGVREPLNRRTNITITFR